MKRTPGGHRAALLPGDSEMARRIRDFDWSATGLGPVGRWPQSLRSSVATCLKCAFPFVLWWGPDLITIYNDEYRPVLGAKHPSALGNRARNVWWEIWEVIGPMVARVMQRGESTRSRDLLLIMERHGYTEECYFSFSYGPIYDEHGGVGGILCPVIETTDRVIGERRLRTLRDLAARCQGVVTEESACRFAAQALAANPHDVPFATIYLLDPERSIARLAASAGIRPDTVAAPAVVPLSLDAADAWAIGSVARSGKTAILTDLRDRFDELPTGAWPDPPHTAMVLPVALPGQELPRAVLVAAVSPRRALGADYRTFFELVATQLEMGLADARALEEERRRAEALAAIDRAKTAFFSNVSHEFRTPLTLILGPLEDALADAREPLGPPQRDRLAVVHRNSLRLLKLVNALLDFSRIEAGRVQASYQAVDLPALTAEVASNFRSACERAGLSLLVDCPPWDAAREGAAWVDREMWEKVVLNLLSNAFKFTFEGAITVRLRAGDGRVELSVTDTGVGMPVEALPHMFERFYRVEGARGRTYEGSGIGLSLVKELVKLHGGTVRVASTLGQGSTFMVSLPLGSAHLPPDRLDAGRTQRSTATGATAFVEEALRWLPGGSEAPGLAEAASGEPPPGPVAPTGGSRPRILWADDNAEMRDYVRRLLEPGYDVHAVPDGEAALSAARAWPPDLVLSDIMLPRMDGLELLRRLRDDPRTREVPVILLSARAGEESRVEGFATGADDYLIKPFSPRELLARVRSHLQLSRVRRDSEQRVTRILESITDAFMVFDAGWRLTYLNPVARQIFASHGMDPDAMIGKHCWDELFPGERESDAAKLMFHAMDRREPVAFENYYASWDEWQSARVDPLPGGGLANYFQDITARKRDEAALRESEERFRGTFENAAVGMAHKDAGGRLLRVNAKYCEIVGYEREELIGRTFHDFTHPEDLPAELARFAAMMRGELASYSLEKRYVRKDGTIIWIEQTMSLQHDAAGAPAYGITVLQDISERKRAETALRERDERLAADLTAMRRLQEVSTRLVQVADVTPLLEEIVEAAIAITSADMGHIQLLDRETSDLRIAVSRGFERAFLEFFDAVHDGQAACGTAMERRERVIVEDVATSPVFAGTTALDAMLGAGVLAVQSTPLLDRSGRLVGMLSTHYRTPRRPADKDLRVLDQLARQAADWIERKHAEEALRLSEERFRRYFELGRIGLAITSPTKGFLEVNDHLCEIFGYERAELSRLTWAELTHPEDLAANVVQFERVLAGESDGYSLDKRWIRKDGKVIYGTISVSCIRRPDRSVDYFVAVLEDLTEHTRFQTALRQSEERYRSLISQVKDYAIFATDERGVVATWNEGCQHVLGYAEEEFLGLDTAELFTPEDRAEGAPAARYHEAAEAGTATDDRWMLAKGGRRFFAVGATAGLRDAAGRLMGYSTVMRDATRMKLSQDALAHHGQSLERLVTERTEELEKAAERLRLSERMASLGTLTAGLGHDMGNLLLPLDVRLELLLRADLPLELHEHVVGIQKCARYLQRLSKGLRLLATDPAGARMEAATELRTWWNDAGMILKDALPRSVEFEHRLPDFDCWIAMGRTALTQAVFNLVQNAGDALRERGTGCVQVSAESELDGAWVSLSVTDDGPGMTAEVLRRCIEPYFSTKSRAVATGMGLPFVHGLVVAAGGRIHVESTRGRGTTIRLTLPRAEPREALETRRAEAAATMADAR